ncbi:MAG: hypothetical protein K0R31_1501 [Clostridiales bacterium]|nr:hypothetical protein [Clostridiales bacterium]
MDNFEINIEANEDYFIFKLNCNKKSYSVGAKACETLPAILTIPSMHNGLPVTAIIENGFAFCAQLSIVLFKEPSSIRTIGMSAFFECTGIESILIPSSIKNIDSHAFGRCAMLHQVYFHSKYPPLLGHKVFSETSPYLNLYVPENRVRIYKAVAEWQKYRDLMIPSPHYIPSNLGFFRFELNGDGKSYSLFAKDGVTTPLNLVIPWYYRGLPVTIIGDTAFRTHKIREVVISDTVEQIGSSAFEFFTTRYNPDYIYSDSMLQSVLFGIKSNLTRIGASAFSGNLKLIKIRLPKKVEIIERNAFFSCGLTSIFIPKNVKSMGMNVFYMSINLKNITVDKRNTSYRVINGAMYDTAATTLVAYPLAHESNVFSPPSTVTDMRNNFWGCRNLRVLLMNSLNPPLLGTLFEGMIPAFKIYVPTESYEAYISASGWGPYAAIIYSQSIIQNGFAIIGETLIQYVQNEPQITIPKEIAYIGNYALTAVTHLEWINVEAENTTFISDNGVLFNSNMSKLIAYPPARKATEYEVPQAVQALGIASFFGSKALSTLYVRKQLEVLEDYSLRRCGNLKNLINLDASDNIKMLGYGALLECVSIKEACFMSLQYSGLAAFSLCYNLKKLTFGPGLKECGGYFISSDITLVQVEWHIFALTPPAAVNFTHSAVKSIHVPAESIDLYKTTTPWSYYSDIIYPLTVCLIKQACIN